MISELYLKRALTIRKDYLKIIKDVDIYEKLIKDFHQVLSDRQSDLEQLAQKIDAKEITNVDDAVSKTQQIIIRIEEEMIQLEKTITSLNKHIQNLAEEEVKLHQEIKKNYIDLSDQQIKYQVQQYIKKFNLS